MKRGTTGTKKTKSHSAYLWNAFFKALLGKKNAATHPTEYYIAVHSREFKLKPAYFRFGDKEVLL